MHALNATFNPRPRFWTARGTLGLLVCTVLAGVGLVLAATSSRPSVPAPAPLVAQDLARGVRALRQHGLPTQQHGRERVLSLTARDLDLATHVALKQLGQQGHCAFEAVLAGGLARCSVLWALPGRWVNLQLRWEDTAGWPHITAAHAGPVPLPTWVTRWLLHRTQLAIQAHEYGGVAMSALGMLRGVDSQPAGLELHYTWDSGAPARAVSRWLPPAEQARLVPYHRALARWARHEGDGATVALGPLLSHLLQLARARGQTAPSGPANGAEASGTAGGVVGDVSGGAAGHSVAGHSASAEHRAALTVLTLYALQRPVSAISPLPALQTPLPLRVVTLDGREDLAQHFLVSAFIAAQASTPLAQAVGVFKEVIDSGRGGSGFSFNDLTADRAGARLGELAARQPQELHLRVQRWQTQPMRDADVLPAWADLPQFLNAPEFARRFSSVDHPAYRQLVGEIDRRIAELPLLR